ncbi:MAG: DNA polymerase III subunit delta' [Panacagrimonas sp.]
MSPDILPWHAQIWSQLQSARAAGRLAHALLLSGPRGVGKQAFARRLAASLLCEARLTDGAACGRCRGCVQQQAGTHPNLIWLAREINEKTDKEKRDISMEQLRTMMERLTLSTHYAQSRVVVIDPADALNTAGVNALLKTIEEPPAGSHVVLISERPMALAATLRSRCQRLSFSVPDPDAACVWLRAAEPGIDASAALAETGGAPLAALAAHREGLLDRHRQWRQTLAELAEQRIDPLTAASRVDKETVEDWLRSLVGFLHQLLRAQCGIGQPNAALARLAQAVGPEVTESMLAETVEGQRRLAGNANPALLIESLMIGWWRRTLPVPSPNRSSRASSASS